MTFSKTGSFEREFSETGCQTLVLVSINYFTNSHPYNRIHPGPCPVYHRKKKSLLNRWEYHLLSLISLIQMATLQSLRLHLHLERSTWYIYQDQIFSDRI